MLGKHGPQIMGVSISTSAIMMLLENLLDIRRTLFINNLYSSVLLVKTLKNEIVIWQGCWEQTGGTTQKL